MLNFQDINVLIISPEDWGPCWVSKHHYAVELTKRGCRVFFLNRSEEPPDSSSLPEGLTVLSAQKLTPGIRFLPTPVRKKLHRRAFQQLSKAAGLKFDLIWSFDASRHLDLDESVVECPSIFFMADFAENLPWHIPTASASLCLGVSHEIVRNLNTYSSAAVFIQHGFAEREAPIRFKFATPRPNAVYSGNLARPSVDLDLLMELAKMYPNCHFHFFGDDGSYNLGQSEHRDNRLELTQFANCTFHGPVEQNLLSSIYQAADALLVPFHPGFDKIGNPHKMMEYLASGTPIISTQLREYEELNRSILFASGRSSFIEGFSRILDGDFDEHSTKRKNFALDHSYPKQVNRIETWLSEQLRLQPVNQ